MCEPEPEADPGKGVLEALREIAEIAPEENLLGDPELREEYRKLKERAGKDH